VTGRDPARRVTDADAPLLARRYGDALRVAHTAAAEQVVDDALAGGMTPSAIQSLIIEPAMTRIGELWEGQRDHRRRRAPGHRRQPGGARQAV
jgi:hypothetical protein